MLILCVKDGARGLCDNSVLKMAPRINVLNLCVIV